MYVELSPDEIREAYDLGRQRRQRALERGFQKAHNLFLYHMLGSFGEVAFEKHAHALGINVDSAFRDPEREEQRMPMSTSRASGSTSRRRGSGAR
jgi:hypothetical protein